MMYRLIDDLSGRSPRIFSVWKLVTLILPFIISRHSFL